MKVTISPTEKPVTLTSPSYATITIEYPTDNFTIDEMVNRVIYPLLLAWGFGEESIKNSIGERG